MLPPANAPSTLASRATAAAPATATAHEERPSAPTDLARLVSGLQFAPEEQHGVSEAILAAMRHSFAARWAELGLSGVRIPGEAAARLRDEARQAAASFARTHNHALARVVGTFARDIAARNGGTLPSGWEQQALRHATEYARGRLEDGPTDLARHMTLRAISLADLHAGGGDSRYVVDGPAITDRSCGTCIAYYGRVLTPRQAWQLVFPAHPNCEHVVRQLTPGELRAYATLNLPPHVGAGR